MGIALRDKNAKGLFLYNDGDRSNYIPGDVVFKDNMLQLVNSDYTYTPWIPSQGFSKDQVTAQIDKSFSLRKSLPKGEYQLSSHIFRDPGLYMIEKTATAESRMDNFQFSKGSVISFNDQARLFVSDTHIRFYERGNSYLIDINTSDTTLSTLRTQLDSILNMGSTIKTEVKNRVKMAPLIMVDKKIELPRVNFTGFVMMSLLDNNVYTSKTDYIVPGRVYDDFNIEGTKLELNLSSKVVGMIVFDSYGDIFS